MKKKLLLADDSITIQKVIAITFSSEDYALVVVDNGDAALEKARSERPDLIMADVFMPGKNGYEVCAAVKQDPALQGVPVLLLTGTFEPFDEGKARDAGADRWIAKPFESQSLIDCVEDLLAKAALAPAAPVAAPVAAAPTRPLPGVPVPPQPTPVVAAAERPLPGIVPPAPVPVAPAVELPAAEDDLWGGAELESSFGELAGADELLATAEPQAETSDDDLWGSVAFEEELPEVPAGVELESAGGDIWGDFGETPEVAAAPVAAPVPPTPELAVAGGGDEALWGDMEADLAAPQPETAIELDTMSWDEGETLPPLGAVEILEEFDLAEPGEVQEFEEAAELGAGLEPGGIELAGFTESADLAAPAWEAAPLEEMALEPPEMEETFADSAVAPIKPAPPATIPATPSVEQQVAALSDEQLQEIVERVAGAVIERLAGVVLEKVAWEVVPDLAEAIVREEMRKIKDAV